MSKFTDFLNLFKWDPVEDAEEEFNIEKSLNENWDKLDTKLKEYILKLQTNKVDKIEGKSLSTADYTNEEKNKLATIENNSQENIIEKIQKNGVDLKIINKVVNLILSKNDIGLNNVDNTSDLDKPLSNAAKEAIKNRKPTIELLTVSSTVPSKCTIRDKYYNTTTSKIYTAIATNTWGITGENPSNLYLYVDLEHKELYYFDGTRFVSYGGGSGGTGGDTVPIGSIVPFASDTIPNGWLLCDGRAVSRTEYAELFKAIGTKHGSGNGSTTFNLPNPKGRTLVGKDSTDTDFNTLGKTGGEKTHTLTVSEMPSHTHDVAIAVNNTVAGGARYYFNSAGTTSAPITDKAAWSNSLTAKAAGGGQAHNNLQPYLTENFIINAKNTAVVKGEIIQENGTASTTNVYSAKAIDNKIENSIKTNIITGQEVATNEYIDGKRVYKRNISAIGENSSGTTLTLSNINFDFSEIWIDESNSFISSESETLSINWYFAPEDYCRLWIGKNTKIIRYRTGRNLSGRTFNVMLKYTKNA